MSHELEQASKQASTHRSCLRATDGGPPETLVCAGQRIRTQHVRARSADTLEFDGHTWLCAACTVRI